MSSGSDTYVLVFQFEPLMISIITTTSTLEMGAEQYLQILQDFVLFSVLGGHAHVVLVYTTTHKCP